MALDEPVIVASCAWSGSTYDIRADLPFPIISPAVVHLSTRSFVWWLLSAK